jgi:SAM-dependent methyltransferase
MPPTSQPERYGDAFYDRRGPGSERSAAAVLDVLLAAGLGPWRRVVDLGCGRGEWLRACLERGATSAVGIDGDWNAPAFDPAGLVRFQSCNLADASLADLRALAGPERFDLAISVEALEHLPPAAGARAVEALVSWSDLVVFSAAIPGQGGRGHQNEQWQSSWVEAFARHGYLAYDVVRPVLWDHADVEPWYRQNVLVFAPAPPLSGLDPAREGFVDLVHPELFGRRRLQLSGRELARAARGLARRRAQAVFRRRPG